MTTSLDAMIHTIAPERVRVILDVGCGTGRFAVPLHARFGARVVGLDPSRHMLAQARQTIQHPAIQFLRAAAECLPLQGACADLAYLSMVYHHLHDATRVAQELSRVLRPDGYVCIRNSVVELLDTFVHLHYFPEARAVLECQLPRTQDIRQHMQGCGFHLLSDTVVKVEFAPSFTHLHEKVQLRAQSELASISDAAFAAGLERMAAAHALHHGDQPIFIAVAHFVFRRA